MWIIKLNHANAVSVAESESFKDIDMVSSLLRTSELVEHSHVNKMLDTNKRITSAVNRLTL